MEFAAYEGTCKYCGSMVPIMAADQRDADLKVSTECECGGHKKEIQHKKMVANIANTFGDKAPDYNLKSVTPNQLEIIEEAAESVFNEHISNVTIGLWGTTAKISRSGTGKIKIVRSQSQSVQTEV